MGKTDEPFQEMTRETMIISDNRHVKTNIVRKDTVTQIHHMFGNAIKNEYQ